MTEVVKVKPTKPKKKFLDYLFEEMKKKEDEFLSWTKMIEKRIEKLEKQVGKSVEE